LYKPQCPDCLEEAHDVDLRPNKAIRDVLAALVSVILPKVEEVVKAGGGSSSNLTKLKDLCSTPRASKTPTSVTPKRVLEPVVITAPSPGSRLPALSSQEPTTSAAAADSSESSQEKTVPCPVCKVPVPERNINQHLDRCLQG
jgi:hypothetical protein